MLSDGERVVLFQIYKLLRVRGVAFTTRRDVTSSVPGGRAPEAIFEKLCSEGYALEIHGVLMLTATGLEECIRSLRP